MRIVAAAVFLASLGAGCTAALDFHECNTSADCKDGKAGLYCNPDHQCVDTSPCRISVEATATGTPLVIAGLYLQSETADGPNDHAIRQAVDLAVIELNTQGVPVRHVACDTGGDTATALKAVDLAVSQYRAVAIVGPNTSSELLGLAPEVKAKGVVVVSPAASSPPIRDLQDDGLIWRTCGSDDLQAKVLSTLVPAGGVLDVVWATGDPYTDNLQKAFAAESGHDATAIQFTSPNVLDAVTQMGSPTTAVLIVDFDAPALVAALATAPGQAMTQYLMTDSALTPTLWGSAPFDFTFLTRIRGTAPALPAFTDPSGPVYASFEQSYRAAFNQESPADTAFVANAYDATYAIAIGAAAVGASPSGAAIAANLKRMSDAGGTSVQVGPGQYQAGVNALQGGSMIDLVGTSGPIDWDDAGDVVTAPTEVWQVADDGSGNPMFKVLSTVTP